LAQAYSLGKIKYLDPQNPIGGKMLENETGKTLINIECRTPSQVANFIIKDLMVAKANSGFLKVVLLAILAGVYIGFGCEISTLAAHDGAGFSGFGPTRVLAGAVFSLGLMLVVIAGGELFTGNTLIAGSVFEGKVSPICLIKNWTLVYFANMVGSVLLAVLVFYANTWQQNDMQLGVYALKVGVAKVNLTFVEAFTRGILCNWLVCLAIWMASASRNVIGKIFAIFFPIMAFIALGYEHCVANMFFIPKAMLLATKPEIISLANIDPEKLSHLNLLGFAQNLIPATLGNTVGAVVFLAFFYWVAFVRTPKLK
jgi:formate transporter